MGEFWYNPAAGNFMTEKSPKKLGLLAMAKFVGEALELDLQLTNEGRLFSDNFPYLGVEAIVYKLMKLRLKELKQVTLAYSSYNHGKFILDSVFPTVDNPEPFHSTSFVVDLSDRPVQVLGWADKNRMTEQGVATGLIEEWIDLGFSRRAIERGIDLEWHFHQFPPQNSMQTGNLLE